MIAGLLGALERLPAGARRAVMFALPLLLVAAMVAGLLLAPRLNRHPAHGTASAQLLPPRASTSSIPPTPPAATTATSGASTTSRGARHTRRSSPRRSKSAHTQSEADAESAAPYGRQVSMVAVARLFAVAYMPYQVGLLPRWVRTAIERACTPPFAHYLLARPAQPTGLVLADPRAAETYRVARLSIVPGPDAVEVNYVSRQDSANTGAFVLTLTDRGGRWLVSRLEL